MKVRDPETVGAKIEKKLQREFGISAPIPWEVEGESRKATLHDALLMAGFSGNLGGSQYQLLYTLPTQQASFLQAGVIFVGIWGWLPAALVYTYDMAPAVSGEARMYKLRKLDQLTWAGKPHFQGQEDVCDALNRCEDIIAGTSNLLRSKVKNGRTVLQVSASASVVPVRTGSTFIVVTLPKISMRVKLQAREFLDLAVAVERAIGGTVATQGAANDAKTG